MHLGVILAVTGTVITAGNHDGPWKIAPRYKVGQEVTYTGTQTEVRQAAGGATFEQTTVLDVGFLVLQTNPLGEVLLGVQTTRRPKGVAQPKISFKKPKETPADNIDQIDYHLARITVDKLGNLSWTDSRANVVMPPFTPPVDELGFGVQVPKAPVKVGQGWKITRPGMPIAHVKIVDFERVQGAPCAKIQIKQESDNYFKEKVSMKAWKIVQTLWVETGTGVIYKVDRVHTLRRPEAPTSKHYWKTTYEMASNFKYHGQIFQDREKEFASAVKLQDMLEEAVTGKPELKQRRLNEVSARLELALKKNMLTPYRNAMHHLVKVTEKEKKHTGETKPATIVIRSDQLARRGTKARSFVARSLDGKTQFSPNSLKGTPYILVFVDNPADMLSKSAVRQCVTACKDRPSTKVLVVCRKVDSAKTAHLKKSVPGDYSLCQGGGIDRAYGLKVYPHVVVVDSAGYMQERFEGVGPELRPGIVKVLEADSDAVKKMAQPPIGSKKR